MKRIGHNLFALGIGFFWGFIIFLPILWLVVSAFRPEIDITSKPYNLPNRFTLDNFFDLLMIKGFGTSILNSFLVAFLTTIITAVISVPVGYLLARYQFKGKQILRVFAVSGYLFAPAVLAFPYFQILSKLGLINSLSGIALTHIAFCLPFALALNDLIFRSVPTSLEEVALMQGNGLLRRLFLIVIPTVKYQIYALLLLIFTISWKEFFFAFIISTDNSTRTLPILLAAQYSGESRNWHLLCALSALLVLPSLIVLLCGRLLQKTPLFISNSR